MNHIENTNFGILYCDSGIQAESGRRGMAMSGRKDIDFEDYSRNYQKYRELFLSLTREEQKEIRQVFLQDAKERGILNFYQELKMQSRFVEAQRDLSLQTDTLQLHSHSFYELLYCCSGNPEYLLGTERYQIQKGDIIMIPPGLSHRPLFTENMKQEYYERIVIWISTDFAGACRHFWPDLSLNADVDSGEIYSAKGHVLHAGNGPWEFLADYFLRIYTESVRQGRACESVICGNALALMGLLARAVSGEAQTAKEKKDLLDDVVHYIENHMGEKITLEETAHHFYISQSKLSKLFRSRMDISFYQFVTQRRLIAAKLLIERGVPLSQIGEQVGFCDYAAFYRAFRREYGLSPTQYKNLLYQK